MNSFEQIHEILDQFDSDMLDETITENLKELNFPTAFLKIPIPVINGLSFMINNYVNLDAMLDNILFENDMEKDELVEKRNKIKILNNLLKQNQLQRLKTDIHILTEYYMLLCMIVIMSKDKFNDTMLAYMDKIQEVRNESEYLKSAEFTKHFHGIVEKIVEFNELKFIKPIYSRVVSNETIDYLYLWLTTNNKSN